jgi:hypothetical protein
MPNDSLPRPPRLFDASQEDVVEYHPLSGLAVTGMLLGLASPAAMLAPLLWVVPLAGVALSGLALWQIARRRPATVGRKMALVALAISVVFAAAAPTDWLACQRLLRREARQFAALWFETLARRAAEKAHQLRVDPRTRRPLDEQLADAYRRDDQLRRALDSMFQEAAFRRLLELGPSVEVRYVDAPAQGQDDNRTWFQLVYAVTPIAGPERKTFFVSLIVERIPLDAHRADWQVLRIQGDIPPPA